MKFCFTQLRFPKCPCEKKLGKNNASFILSAEVVNINITYNVDFKHSLKKKYVKQNSGIVLLLVGRPYCCSIVSFFLSPCFYWQTLSRERFDRFSWKVWSNWNSKEKKIVTFGMRCYMYMPLLLTRKCWYNLSYYHEFYW